jgi:hypothetical protein
MFKDEESSTPQVRLISPVPGTPENSASTTRDLSVGLSEDDDYTSEQATQCSLCLKPSTCT